MLSKKIAAFALSLTASLLGCGSKPHGPGSITTFPLPHANSLPQHIVKGPDGNMWFLEQDGRIGRITAAGTIAEFQVPEKSNAHDITAGPDGALWFTERAARKVGRITTTGTVTELPTGLTGMVADRIVSMNGALWFSASTGDGLEVPKHIVRITTSAKVTTFDLPIAHGLVNNIVAGPDDAIWFTVSQDAQIGRFDVTTHTTALFSKGLDPDPLPMGIVAGPDDAMWFAQQETVGRIDLKTHAITTFAPPKALSPTYFTELTLGPDGNLWFSDFNYDRIWRVDPHGTMTPFSDGIRQYSSPNEIAVGSDGALWFTLYNGNAIGRLQTS